ncbi:hypothetical protein NE236_42540 [Actinoallomurus purpureus]|uniref:hypothetical protein n=1 Tax=Actinoallomurus purpureus TaxID=478114 RepID=UPI002092EA94|nr:hypothetical protein [Actinoallomurus purpureus]MCO6011649.1 hypothetical protein [Actinoallomurus purpureus]
MIAVPILTVALAVLGVVFVVLVLVGARREAPWTALDDQPPTPLASFARAVLGVYVRKNTNDQPIEPTQITELIKGRR